MVGRLPSLNRPSAYFQRRLLLGLGGVLYESHSDPPLKHMIKPCLDVPGSYSKWLGSMGYNIQMVCILELLHPFSDLLPTCMSHPSVLLYQQAAYPYVSLAMAAFSSRSSRSLACSNLLTGAVKAAVMGDSTILCLQDERKKPVISSVNQ